MNLDNEERILDAQLKLYCDDRKKVRGAAVELASIGDDALPTMIAALEEPRAAAHVHEAVLDAIASSYMGPVAAPAIPSILRFLRSDIANGQCQSAAISALRSIGREAVDPVCHRFRIADPDQRRLLRLVLISLPYEAIAPNLIEMLSEPDGDLRLSICSLIHYVCRDEPMVTQAVTVLTKIMELSDPHVRAAAASALANFGYAGIRSLWDLVSTAKDAEIRCLSLAAIVECVQLFPHLIQSEAGCVLTLLRDTIQQESSVEVQLAASVSLHRLAEHLVKHRVNECIDKNSEHDRIKAMQALSSRSFRPYAHMLDELTEQATGADSLRLRRMTAAAIVSCDEAAEERVIEILRQGLCDPEDTSRDQYLQAAKLGGAWAAPLLPTIIAYIRNGDPLCELAVETVEAIGLISDELVDLLLNYLVEGKDYRPRVAALKALAKFASSNPKVIAALADLVQDLDLGWSVCRTLGRMGKRAARAVDRIEQAVQHSWAVPEALRRIGTPEAVAALWRLYNTGPEGYGDIGRNDASDLYDRAYAELVRLGEIKTTNSLGSRNS